MDELIVALIKGTHAGCSFHYGMTLNRNQDGLLRDVIAEEPEDYIQLTGLLQPPEGVSKDARRSIWKFFHYYKTNWLQGFYADMWNKYLVTENRTTNMAENYHSRVLQDLKSERPNLETLLKVINEKSSVSYYTLKRNNPHNLRKEDQERKDKIAKEMMAFDKQMKEVGITNIPKEKIYQYLDNMSVFITTKHV